MTDVCPDCGREYLKEVPLGTNDDGAFVTHYIHEKDGMLVTDACMHADDDNDDDDPDVVTDGGVVDDSSERSLRIDHWDCEDCILVELEQWEKEAHEQVTDHTLIARYV